MPPSNSKTSVRQTHNENTSHSKDLSKSDIDNCCLMKNDDQRSINSENILFVCLDIHSQLNSNVLLRTINNNVQTFVNPSICLDMLRSSNDRIFFISSFADKELIEEVHQINTIERIFLINCDGQMDSRYPKFYGIYDHWEELLKALKKTLQWFEETQMELFHFQGEKLFLWSQLWKEEFLKSSKSTSPSAKAKLVHTAENASRGNMKMHQSIHEFEQCYHKIDSLHWCFSSPFPSDFIRHALRHPHIDHINASRFFLTDVSRTIHQHSKQKSSCEFYKGMKITKEFLDQLEKHTDQLICPKGFLQCTHSRKTALDIANSPDHRSDLNPVLFKILSHPSVPIAEVKMKDNSSFLVFDLYTTFRVKYVTRGQVSNIKLVPAEKDGRIIAQNYRLKHQSESVQNLLDQLLIPPKPPIRSPILPVCVTPALSEDQLKLSRVSINNDEMRADDLVQNGQIDEAISIYLNVKPDSARILNTIGMLYTQKKGDYESAIKYHKKALEIQEKNGDDITESLSQLGLAHHNRREFDLALSCHSRVLGLRQMTHPIDPLLTANSLLGVSNAYWGQENLSEALNYAQQALTLNQSIQSGNELNIATNLGILANIYHCSNNNDRALELAKQAFLLLERFAPSDSLALGTLLNNMAAIQVTKGLFTDARQSLNRALDILKKYLPEGHSKRIAIENNIQRITLMEQRINEQLASS